jgi:hypothetical protein
MLAGEMVQHQVTVVQEAATLSHAGDPALSRLHFARKDRGTNRRFV